MNLVQPRTRNANGRCTCERHIPVEDPEVREPLSRRPSYQQLGGRIMSFLRWKLPLGHSKLNFTENYFGESSCPTLTPRVKCVSVNSEKLTFFSLWPGPSPFPHRNSGTAVTSQHDTPYLCRWRAFGTTENSASFSPVVVPVKFGIS